MDVLQRSKRSGFLPNAPRVCNSEQEKKEKKQKKEAPKDQGRLEAQDLLINFTSSTNPKKHISKLCKIMPNTSSTTAFKNVVNESS